MKVYCLIDCLGSGGAQRQMVGLAKLLKMKGYTVRVGFYHDISFYTAPLEQDNIENIYLKNAKRKVFRIPAIYSELKTWNPDVVISYQEIPSLVACVCKLMGVRAKLIVSERNTTQKIKMIDLLRFNLYRVADAIVSNSYSQSNFIKTNFPFLKSKATTITNFVNTDFFAFSNKSNNTTQNKSKLHILVIATMWPPKNLKGFILACKLLVEKHLEFIVDWYGSNQSDLAYYRDCVALINQLGLNGRVRLHAPEVDVVSLYQNTDVFCLPSFYEGFPNVVCEALSCGKIVLCSDVCDNSRIIEDGVNGFLFDPRSKESMLSAFERYMMLDTKQKEDMEKKNREKAVTLFSPSILIQNYITLLK